jgi:uncharacterized beta-barrel protein YwiB (DUF1934 family)
MKNLFYLSTLVLLLFSSSCSDDSDALLSTSDSDAVSGEDSNNGGNGQSGLITAGEWNDLDQWPFWMDLIRHNDFSFIPDHWSFYTKDNRISLLLKSQNEPAVDAEVRLVRDNITIWRSRSDNQGKVELWIDLFQKNQIVQLSEYSLEIEGKPIDKKLNLHKDGMIEINVASNASPSNRVELSFIVDATGSMGDELAFLKQDLVDVIQRVEDHNSALDVFTSCVFYKDTEDDFLVRNSDFSGDINSTVDFIKGQKAGGGGDFPEAVHSALKTGLEELQWSDEAKTRIAFLLLDAPPHHEPQVISDLQQSIKAAAKKGIKVIPITASGIDKETEFLMRFFCDEYKRNVCFYNG